MSMSTVDGLAKMVNASESRLRRIRVAGECRDEALYQRLSGALVFVEFLRHHCGVADPITWLSVPLDDLPAGYRVSPASMYREGATMTLAELATGRRSAESALDELVPDWRETRFSPHDLVDASGCCLSIVTRRGST